MFCFPSMPYLSISPVFYIHSTKERLISYNSEVCGNSCFFFFFHKFNFLKNIIYFLFQLCLIFCGYFPSFVAYSKNAIYDPLLNIVIVVVICKFVFSFLLYLYWEVIKYLFLNLPQFWCITNTLGMLSSKNQAVHYYLF